MYPATLGATRPSREGPSRMPATTSPMTGGWPIRTKRTPRARPRATTTASARRTSSSRALPAEDVTAYGITFASLARRARGWDTVSPAGLGHGLLTVPREPTAGLPVQRKGRPAVDAAGTGWGTVS